MSEIRMQEAWAMAHWLARNDPPAFGVEDDEASTYDLLLWSDNAITRIDSESEIPAGATRIYEAVQGTSRIGILTSQERRLKMHEQPMSFIPFSTYDLGDRPPQALCILYSSPDRKNAGPQRIAPLPPRDCELIAHAIAMPNERFMLYSDGHSNGSEVLTTAPAYGKLVRTRMQPAECKLRAIPL